jgi:predicted small lipoprotein YifL
MRLRKLTSVAALCAVLAGCGASGPTEQADKDVIASFTSENGNEVRYLVMNPNTAPEQMFQTAQTLCIRETSCFAYVWLDPKEAASAAPMLPREEKSYVFKYQLKRHAGVEKGFWDCARYRQSEDNCIIR